jgi:hypothetical protein
MEMLAHQGGWDEILLVLAPILVIAGLVKLVHRRAERAAAVDAQERSSTRSIDAPSEDNFPTRSS